ncbi:VanZ family protein [Lacinutrix sp. C3R15]|uniref:VanZ family protein n=1 Tax=Flavobacteriaceae TaxID=49546 RepID=UPI001C08888A|nr:MULTISPECIES: VanZ family protein [Flavobacteriaceae]MBU2940069.1 VanZ family protein [Lacinutrix sp. C3R15]MDO6623386.1 VanZ family protein [Oceanihabitans sp. 1_MG-2023]
MLTIVSLISVTGLPDLNYSNSDKILHFIAYSGLTLFWFLTFSNNFKWAFNKALLLSAIVSVVFGIIIEILQGVLTETRVADNNDILANTLGVSLTIIILLLFKKALVKK